MQIKEKTNFRRAAFGLLNLLSIVFLTIAEIRAQMPSVAVPSPEEEPVDDFTWQRILLFVLVLGLVGAIFWWFNSRQAVKVSAGKRRKSTKKPNPRQTDYLDTGKEMEWLKKNRQIFNSGGKNKNGGYGDNLPKARKSSNGSNAGFETAGGKAEIPLPLPIFSIDKIKPAQPFTPLMLSSDEALLSAIEQVNDEFEEDETVRELAVRILTAFRTRNSIESLSQVALYDLSSNLRSKAVSVLSEFDHESVFETILLACADPTREVRAAAARGLSHLSFNRADAWARISETEEDGRIVQAARAASEGGMVEMCFSRIVHSDRKFAYEGFVLLVLLINADETQMIFDALEKNPDINVRRAILHIIKVTKNKKALEGLYSLLERNSLPLELQEEVDKTIEEIGFVTA